MMIMAGGKGSRLAPLTSHRAKPAVPFGGRYRIIDFVLSNAVNSGYRRIYVLTQYMASSLIHHLQRNWVLSSLEGFIEIAPAQMRLGEHWYRGTADSIFQNYNLVRDDRADVVGVFGGDHVYKCDISQMEAYHWDCGADLTVAAFPVPVAEGSEFGVIQVDENWRIVGFEEKPANPKPIPGRPDMCLVSMGNYFFQADVLEQALHDDGQDPDSAHDFGRNIIPGLVAGGAPVFAYDFSSNEVPGDPPDRGVYWRDVGSTDSYIAANMDIRSRVPALNLYNRQWRIRSAQRDYPPARFVHEEADSGAHVLDSLVSEGCIISGARVRKTLLGYDCFVHSSSLVDECIVLAGCDIGTGSQLRHVLMDKNCMIERGAFIGIDPVQDARRFPWITDGGWVVLPKGTFVPRDGPIELASDMHAMLENDPAALAGLQGCEVAPTIRPGLRHSYRSAGPRYKAYRPPEG